MFDHHQFSLEFSKLIKSASYNPFSSPKTLTWIPTTDCCSWDGIKCDELTGHVISIDLSSSLLYGSMDPNSTFFSLVHLQSLDLSDNDFNHSQIPARGTLPASIGNLTNLAHLALEDNSFHGENPRSLFRLKNLELLSLSENLFEGRLALDMFLKLKMLNILDLSFNKLSLFSQNRDVNVTILPPIQWLGLSGCNLNGEIPTWIMNLTTLNCLGLSRNDLQGEIPYFLFKLENLTILDLAGNMFEGQIELDMLSKLQKLTLLGLGGGNKLSFLEGKNTSNVTFPSQIQTLDLSSFNLVRFPNFIQHLQELTDLFLSDNSIKTIPSWLWNKTTLQILDISNNLLMGEISPSICNLQSLVELVLSSNDLVGMIPSCLGSFSQSLQLLDVSGNKLTGNIPQIYEKGNVLQFIDFSSNKLYGQLPRALVNCRMLEFLDVRHNHFNDSFPFWLGSLPKLKDVIQSDIAEIDIDSHPFSMSNKGVVMDYLGSQYLHHMVAIDLSCNKISGEIPDIMGSLNGLVVLNLSNNMFTGSIPSFFGKLSNLEVLDLSLNSLSGNIPQ
ncbi:Receptor-like protein [Arachis hypogaea]|nr:Receptor-like protein [Arachis hypogaea]